MKLQEIFDHLTAGEFSQLNLFGAGQGVINDDNIDKVISHISLGLTDLYGRFTLKKGKVLIQLQADQTSYWLNSKYAVHGKGNFTPKYILDSASAPFKDDVLLILDVLDELGQEIKHTKPSMDTVDIPLSNQLTTSTALIKYQANHLVLDPNTMSIDPDRLDIEIPRTHLTALLYFVASRANNPVGLGQEFNAGNTYATKYENECMRLKVDGMQIQDREPESKFHSRGFI